LERPDAERTDFSLSGKNRAPAFKILPGNRARPAIISSIIEYAEKMCDFTQEFYRRFLSDKKPAKTFACQFSINAAIYRRSGNLRAWEGL
jgi:hypothetical protein